ncbi:MAG TPA: SAM-dependent methyltransferase [Streptosporangiaceae bacterium]|jgi:trans-aconitate methyltransferase|nr:SAM-dependent methyltransferase [Streptosporangiaceae bacterium]
MVSETPWPTTEAAEKADPRTFDSSVAHIARVYNYWLGGKDNYAADRAAGDRTIAEFPGIVTSARANRAFLRRAVRFLVTEAGVRQFLDIGTGIPTSGNTHEVAQSLAPQSRIVYVDNDPVVLAHARALLTSTPEGATDYLDANLKDPAPILARAVQTLDFSRPVAIMLFAVLQLLKEDDDPYQVVADLLAAVPSGSYLALSHPTSDVQQDQVTAMVTQLNHLVAEKVTTRDRDQVARFFTGLELAEPGLVNVSQWRPDADTPTDGPAALWVGVARKP